MTASPDTSLTQFRLHLLQLAAMLIVTVGFAALAHTVFTSPTLILSGKEAVQLVGILLFAEMISILLIYCVPHIFLSRRIHSLHEEIEDDCYFVPHEGFSTLPQHCHEQFTSDAAHLYNRRN